MTSDLDDALAGTEPPAYDAISTVTERRCSHLPRSSRILDGDWWSCVRCGHRWTAQAARSGRTHRKYGNNAELLAARRYGGVKTGHHGGPVDIRGTDWATQMKTHRRKPPAEWVKAFAGMAAGTDRLPRLLLRFVHGTGHEDFFVIKGADFLDWYGRDEEPTP